VFVLAVSGENNTAPVTLWLNGGPGCSSMIGMCVSDAGFLQEIGPYYLESGRNWTNNDTLTKNDYSWNKASNLLFLEAPAGVGYSYNLDDNWKYNDSNVAQDNLNALVDFFTKFKEYSKTSFYLAGESYAGKYIPDLAVLIDKYNRGNPLITINMKGLLIGNGVMSFQDNELEHSEIDYVVNHEFVDPELIQYWRKSCRLDPVSAGCGFFKQRFVDNAMELNPQSIYDYCYYNDTRPAADGSTIKKYSTQESILKSIRRRMTPFNLTRAAEKSINAGITPKDLIYNDSTCAYFNGIHDYFNNNDEAFHAKFKGQPFNGPCVSSHN
jgi:hypothetical protein